MEILESERKVEIKKIENEFSQKIEQLNELIMIMMNNILDKKWYKYNNYSNFDALKRKDEYKDGTLYYIFPSLWQF